MTYVLMLVKCLYLWVSFHWEEKRKKKIKPFGIVWCWRANEMPRIESERRSKKLLFERKYHFGCGSNNNNQLCKSVMLMQDLFLMNDFPFSISVWVFISIVVANKIVIIFNSNTSSILSLWRFCLGCRYFHLFFPFPIWNIER